MNSKALVPKYVHQFKCAKSACLENCCSDLHVVLDEDTVDLYSTSPALIPLVQEHLFTDEESPIKQMVLDKDPATKTCPLLDDDNLCIMHRDFGEDTLPQICATYPRNPNWLGEDLVLTLSDSCPEVARLLVETEDAMELDLTEYSFPDAMQLPKKPTRALVPNQFHYLQTILTILRHKEQPLELRLFIISLYSERADTAVKNKEPDALPKLTELFFNLINEGYFEKQARKLQNPDKHALGLVLLNVLRQQGVKGSLFKDVKNILIVLEMHSAAEFNEVHLAKLNQAERLYLQPLLESLPDALENILANWLITDLYPLKDISFTDGLLKMLLRYLFLKTLLSGVALHQGKLTKEDFIKITYRFSRSISLSPTFYELEATLKKRNLNNIATFTHALNI